MVRLISVLTAVWFLSLAAGPGVAAAKENRGPGILTAKKDKEKGEKALKEKEERLEAREKALQAKEEVLKKAEADLKKREEGLKNKPTRSRHQTRQGVGAGPREHSGTDAGFGRKMPAPATLKPACSAPAPKSPPEAPATPGT
jgi:hypothetical protein